MGRKRSENDLHIVHEKAKEIWKDIAEVLLFSVPLPLNIINACMKLS